MTERRHADGQQRIQFIDARVPEPEAFGARVPAGGLKVRRRHVFPGDNAVQQSEERLVGGGVFFNRRRQVLLQRLADAVKILVLAQRSLRVAGDAVLVVLLEHRGHDGDLRLVGHRAAGAEPAADLQNGVAQPLLRLRQGRKRGVHQVITVEIGVEDEVGKVAGVRNHRADGGDEFAVGVIAGGGRERRGLQTLPVRQHRRQPRVVALARDQLGVGEFQRAAQIAVVIGGQRVELRINLPLKVRQPGFGRFVARLRLAGRGFVAGKQIQQCFQRALEGVAPHFLRAKGDVLVDRGADDEQQDAGHGQQTDDGGQQDVMPEFKRAVFFHVSYFPVLYCFV